MRRAVYVLAMLTLAALACNTPGLASSPTTVTVQQPSQQQPTPTPPTVPQPSPGERATELTPEQIAQIARSSVQILAAQNQGGSLEPLWTGSGTIISPDGEILTNCHVACGAPVLEILITSNPDQPPEPKYIAEISHYDENLDLALLRITSDLNGNPVTLSNLPYLEIGNSDQLQLGDKLYIFGYPGVGGETITFTTGAVSGFESATVGGQSQRVVVKTDAEIASGNSGGTAVDLSGRLVAVPTAVNPDVREGVTLGGLGILRPVNLVTVVRQQAGAPPPLESADLPPGEDPDPYEPNETLDEAYGPLNSGDQITAYITWAEDIDVFWFTSSTTAPIEVSLYNIPSGTDYDLYLLDSNADVLASSESETAEEYISYTPRAAGTYWIGVISYSGASASQPYTLVLTYDGGRGGGPSTGEIRITGRAVDGATGQPLGGGVFGILSPNASCAQFFGARELDMSLVVAFGETNSAGYFELGGVPRGATYSAFFVYGNDYICEDGWLDVPTDAVDSDLGDIEMSFR